MITVNNGVDFRLVMGSYASYLIKMNQLIDSWNLTVRKLFEFLEIMSSFAPGVESCELMCHTPRDLSRPARSAQELMAEEIPPAPHSPTKKEIPPEKNYPNLR